MNIDPENDKFLVNTCGNQCSKPLFGRVYVHLLEGKLNLFLSLWEFPEWIWVKSQN